MALLRVSLQEGDVSPGHGHTTEQPTGDIGALGCWTGGQGPLPAACGDKLRGRAVGISCGDRLWDIGASHQALAHGPGAGRERGLQGGLYKKCVCIHLQLFHFSICYYLLLLFSVAFSSLLPHTLSP